VKMIIPRENAKLENVERILIIAKKPLFFPLIEKNVRTIWQNFPSFLRFIVSGNPMEKSLLCSITKYLSILFLISGLLRASLIMKDIFELRLS